MILVRLFAKSGRHDGLPDKQDTGRLQAFDGKLFKTLEKIVVTGFWRNPENGRTNRQAAFGDGYIPRSPMLPEVAPHDDI